MSLATRCPACGTIFRVVQDQLKVSEGWVRCGQCHEVFHGIEALFDLDSDAAVAARRTAPRAPAPTTRVFAETRAGAAIPLPKAPPPPSVFAPQPSAFAPTAPGMFPPTAPASLSPPLEATRPIARSPIAIPARAPAPVDGGRSVSATPSAFGSAALPPALGAASNRPAFAPVPNPGQVVIARGTIAPRFAARLAEESARAQAAAPAPVAAARIEPTWEEEAVPPSFEEVLSPTPAHPLAYAYAPEPAAEPVPEPAPDAAFEPSFEPPTPSLADEPSSTEAAAPAPIPLPPAPAPVPTPAELAAAFAAPPPLPLLPSVPDAQPQPFPVAIVSAPPAPEPVSDVGDAVILSRPADDAEDADEADDEDRAGPPTLASLLPEDAGEWPPRKSRKANKKPAKASGERALVDPSKDPRFLREARSGARWRKPWVRAVLGAAFVLLALAAAGQVAWPQRDALASHWPASRPAWDWLCAQAGCRIEAPRALASLALDGSSLTRTDTEHVLLFSADLHNRSNHEVRMPSFDLSFLDLNGAIVARKVLSPTQIGIRQTSLPADGELHVHARLQVSGLDATGFQADLFYP